MPSTLLMIQAIAQNIALFCCALFAGGSIYVSLVEDPAAAEGDIELASAYLLWAHLRPAVVQASFAAIAALAGILTGLAGGTVSWVIGGVILGMAAVLYLYVVIPETRSLRNIDPAADSKHASRLFARLARLHAALSLASLGALFIFIMQT